VLQKILEDATNRDFATLLQRNVFDPLKMNRSMFRQSVPQNDPDTAVPYDAGGLPVSGGLPVFVAFAAGGLWTTPTDLAGLAVEIQKELAGKSNRILTKKTVEDMLRPGLGSWGLGFQIGGTPPQSYFAHEGSDVGYNCYMVAYDRGDGAVIMTNGMGQLEYEIVRSIARAYGWPDLKPAERKVFAAEPAARLDDLTGVYNFVTITRQGDKLLFEIPGAVRKNQLYPESPSRYFSLDNPVEFEFHFGDSHRASSVTFDTKLMKLDLQRTR
jgi:CubicO group peptidase (beta-lactamase class C family)